MVQRTSEVIERLLADAGSNFELDPPHRLSRSGRWSWQELAHVLLFATWRVEQDERGVLHYLERLFPAELNFDLDRLEPLARTALAEIFNIWGVALWRYSELTKAIGMFDAALRSTRDARLHHHALYNRGHAHAEIAIDLLTRRGSKDELGVEARLERALADLERVTKLDASDAAAWASTGLVRWVRASNTQLPVRRRLRDYRRAVAAFQVGLEHERDADERASMASKLALAAQGVDALESLGLVTRLFGRSSHRDHIEWPTRAPRFSPSPTKEPFPIAAGSAAAPVSLAPGCGVWVHDCAWARGQYRAVLCVLSDASPRTSPGRSTPAAILDLSNGTVSASALATMATSFGLTDADVIRVHELGNKAAAAALNRCGWEMVARAVPGSKHALRLLRAYTDAHVLVGVEIGADEMLATNDSYSHFVGLISSASLSPEQRDEALTRLVVVDARFWTTASCVDRPLLFYTGVVGVPVTVIDST